MHIFRNKGDKKNKGYDGTHKRSKKDIGTKAEKEPIKHTIVPDHNAAPVCSVLSLIAVD